MLESGVQPQNRPSLIGSYVIVLKYFICKFLEDLEDQIWRFQIDNQWFNF